MGESMSFRFILLFSYFCLSSYLMIINFVGLNAPILHKPAASWITVRPALSNGTNFSSSST